MRSFFQKLKKVLILLFIIVLGIGLICFGLKLNKMSKKHYMIDITLDTIRDKLYDYGKLEDQYFLGDEFSIKSTIKTNISSEEYPTKAAIDLDYSKKNNLINNLSNMQVEANLQHSKKSGKLLAELKETIGQEEIIHGKYYVDNYTKYYFVNGILSNYVNDGNNNYFGTLNEKNTSKDNIDYLYNYLFEAIKRNIKEEDLMGSDVEINLGDSREPVGQVSLKITNKYYRNLLNNVLKDIKKDEKANEILTGIYPKFKKTKVDMSKQYLGTKESYTINIYLRKLVYKPVKYEIVHLDDDTQEIYSFEGTLESGVLYYSKNNELKYSGKCESNPQKLEIIINNVEGQETGTIKLEKTSNSVSFNANLDLDEKNYQLSYSTIFKDYKKGKSYTRNDTLTYKETDNAITKINGSIIIESKVTNKPEIKEDIDSAVLSSTLNDETKDKLDKLYENIKARLER